MLVDTPEDKQTVEFLQYGFPAGYQGMVPSSARSTANQSSANAYPKYLAVYISTEVGQGVMLCPFDSPPFHPWYLVNPLLTRPKKDSTNRWVITDLS